jgi:hypothetical protein
MQQRRVRSDAAIMEERKRARVTVEGWVRSGRDAVSCKTGKQEMRIMRPRMMREERREERRGWGQASDKGE